MTSPAYEISDETKASYIMVKYLPEQGWCGVLQLMFHYTIHTGIDDVGYHDKWCIDTEAHAIEALLAWDGTGEPMYWHKHLHTGMRRNPRTDVRWPEDEPEPTNV